MAEPDRETRELEGSRVALGRLFGPVAERSFAVRFWDGTTDAPPGRAPDFTLVLRHAGALRRAVLPPTDARMGEAFAGGHLDVEGDLEAVAGVAEALKAKFAGALGLLRLAATAAGLPRGDGTTPAGSAPPAGAGQRLRGRRHSRARDSDAIRYHYDVGNGFFRTFLDARMVYSCGYFPSGDETLDEAQEAKLDLICRKLRLREGERFLDIGCGWGALAVFAAERYGVDATGITLSPSQAKVARERVAEAGLGDRCRIEVRDYRALGASERFDKIASVGMVEHVGRAQLPTYFGHVERLLAPGGLFLNHGIVSLEPTPRGVRQAMRRRLARRHSFIQRFVFPDSELVSPGEVIGPGERAELELRDVESLREHYATTLRHWVRRLESNKERAVLETRESTYRVWRLYMAASAHLFSSAKIGVIQALWAKRDARGEVDLPASRADLYRHTWNATARSRAEPSVRPAVASLVEQGRRA